MKTAISSIILLFFTMSVMSQRLVFNGQNQIHRQLEDPSFISLNSQYNMTGVLQVSDSDIAQTSQYISAQLSLFDNVAFGLDYSKHSYDVYRYSQMFLSSRFRLNLGNEFHYFNLGASIGQDKLNEANTSKDNSLNTIYKLGLHYTNFNLTLGGVLNRYPVQNDLTLNMPEPLSSYEGYTLYLSYRMRLSDNMRLTPMIKYNSYSDLTFFEGVTNLNYKGNYELAVSYKDDYSINAALSARFLKYVRLSYSYESAIGSQNFNDVHSIGVSVDLTPKETEIPEWLANVKRNREKINRIKKIKKEEPTIVKEQLNVNNEETNEADNVSDKLVNDEEKYPVMDESTPSDIIDDYYLKPGYYIILGSFKQLKNADKEIARLKQNGFYARYGRKDANDEFNYVYVDRYAEKDIASQRTKAKQKEKGFERVWLLKIE
ncbi:Sporulation related domain-containing protein [Flaviramulus basaltis]|uniref:Sporulation related domain-containing protein n=1 Tax=Flaviramulus basaltis TaxID=369401 RepID=A0A1K2IKG4_9FLAO|nr:SPOR domain-containing protein [Flaviramulus basaltis]SFZ92806.1 Sporulation related domain-containing protein [Flaviramulus basaltis]